MESTIPNIDTPPHLLEDHLLEDLLPGVREVLRFQEPDTRLDAGGRKKDTGQPEVRRASVRGGPPASPAETAAPGAAAP